MVSCAFSPSRALSLWYVVTSGAVGDTGGGGGVLGTWTVSATVAAWVRLAAVPVSVTVGVAAAAPLAAVSVVLCAVPGVRESVAGFAVTPEGSPLMFTETVLLNPFVGTALTLIFCPPLPAVSVSAAGETDREKSGDGWFGGVVELEEEVRAPPPHEASPRTTRSGTPPSPLPIADALLGRAALPGRCPFMTAGLSLCHIFTSEPSLLRAPGRVPGRRAKR